MSTTVSKRQQARNERTLQELIKDVPGNAICADCGARNPGWASWSLGVFLCLRCAALHRKIGTHVSKVKSLSMDQWSNEQVDVSAILCLESTHSLLTAPRI
ncbi:UBA domain-containing protein 3 [Elasticomyces elasticus]|nr:UBA domain-containing protein 3 [Elasticomyces elasticus]